MSNWKEYFNNATSITIDDFSIDNSWNEIFNKHKNKINKVLNTIYQSNETVYPAPDSVFKAFNKTSLGSVKVVLLGQDPYHSVESIYSNGKYSKIPQANGLSFSVHSSLRIPSSLKNIYKNMVENNVLSSIPINGDLTHLAEKGILLINSSLTVIRNNPGSHTKLWNPIMADILIDICSKFNISKNKLLFVVLGKHAYNMCENLFVNKNITFLISSHPSGLSCNNRITIGKKIYQSFKESNHFGLIQKYHTINFNQ